MPRKKRIKIDDFPKDTDSSNIRASISFPREDYLKLEELASAKRVSLAWIVRESVRLYLKNQYGMSKDGTHDTSF